MLIGLFCRVKTLLITTSNNIVETRLQTIEIKKTTGFLISILVKKEFSGVQEIPPPPARSVPLLFSWLSLQVLNMISESFEL